MAQDVDEEEPVLGRDVARAEHRAGARGAVHVGDSEALVAQDRHVGARAVLPVLVAGLHPEARVLVVLPDVGAPQLWRYVHQVAVHGQLVVAVLRPRAARLEIEQLLAVVEAVLARREDVQEALVVAVLVRVGGAESGGGGAQHDDERGSDGGGWAAHGRAQYAYQLVICAV